MNIDTVEEVKNKSFKITIAWILIVVALILIFTYFIKLHQIKNKEKTSVNYLIKNNYILNEVKNIQELKQVLTESPSTLIIYLSYHNSNKIYNIEKKIAKAFNEYDILDNTYIYDITTLKNKVNNYKEVLDDTLDINVTTLPVIVIYEDGQIKSYKTVKNYEDVINIFEKNNIEKNSH